MSQPLARWCLFLAAFSLVLGGIGSDAQAKRRGKRRQGKRALTALHAPSYRECPPSREASDQEELEEELQEGRRSKSLRPKRVQRGRVSYYHDSLAGNCTASGESYDPEAHTAASRTLPLGTIVRVVRLDNGQSVMVRINDRGPQRKRRILDLSRGAAESLDMIEKGVVRVRVEVLRYGRRSSS